ncbi:hypothetical protein GQ53DRAFT_670129 [Thozetella sp. PMI_491]|nr:hypothetical protein GQ53DRAFT_670129 [Thozetella sp. PMI_491]
MATAQQRLGSIPLYRPEQMRNISLLTEQEKIKYERGLASLWRMHDNAPQGSPESNEAKRKIMDFGKMLAMKMQERKNQAMQSRQAPPQLQQPPQQGPPQPVQQPAASVLPAVTMDSVAGAQVGTSAQPGAVANAGASAAANGPAKPGTQARLPQHIADHLSQISFQAPASVPDQDKTRWAHELKVKYTRALVSMESTRQNVARLDQTLKERQEKGNPLSPEEQKSVVEKKGLWQKQYAEAQNFLNQARKQYVVPQPRPQQNGAAVQAGGVGDGSGSVTGPTAAPSNAMQTSTATVNAAIEAAKNQQLAAGRPPGTNGLTGSQPPQSQTATSLAQAQPSPATTTSSQPQPPQLTSQPPAQTPIKIEPGTQPNPAPAPLNTAIASTAAAGLPSAGTPTQNSARIHTPQTATPTAGAPRPLTHTAALHLANQRSASVPGPSASAPGSAGQQVSAAGVIGTAQGHLHAHPAQAGTPQLPSKLPIPKVLPEKATQVPTPVAAMGGLGNGRPSYSAGSGIPGGVMGQPVMAKMPAYQLEGEGERILNKKKLDELVKQVCGGTTEGQEGNLLTPEVEESVLNLADSFVDDVLHAACRNAKERGSKVLEIRDIQLVLERTYNIRIPGYSSDELRIVRKIQPSAQWITKMSAVQAAKVMPGKGDL